MEIYTIGFTKRSAEDFFGALRDARIEQVVDVRLRNDSTLAGFTRMRDLPFFLRELAGASYWHEPRLAPEPDALDKYRRKRVSWDEYEMLYLALLEERNVSETLDPGEFGHRTALLCSEPTPLRCHRRLAAEYLAARWPDTSIVHL